MKIRNVVHKGLRRFIEEDEAAGLQSAVAPKLRRIVSFLQDMEREEELRTVPSWKVISSPATAREPGACSSPRTGVLMRMQNSCDIARTRKRAAEIKVARYQGQPADTRPTTG